MKFKIMKLKKMSETSDRLIATGMDCFTSIDAETPGEAFLVAIEQTPAAKDWLLCAVDENGHEYAYLTEMPALPLPKMCEYCKFWSDKDEEGEILLGLPGKYTHTCVNPIVNRSSYDEYRPAGVASYETIAFGSKFGCIHWESR